MNKSLSPFSEPMWPIEARCAAIANTYFVACNNRVGTVSVCVYVCMYVCMYVCTHILGVFILSAVNYITIVYRKFFQTSSRLEVVNQVRLCLPHTS